MDTFYNVMDVLCSVLSNDEKKEALFLSKKYYKEYHNFGPEAKTRNTSVLWNAIWKGESPLLMKKFTSSGICTVLRNFCECWIPDSDPRAEPYRVDNMWRDLM